MPVKEKGKTPSPSPWGWPPAGQSQRPQGPQIGYNTTRQKAGTIPKGRPCEQDELYHKKGALCTSGLYDAPDAGTGLERLRPRGAGRLDPVLRADARRQGGDMEAGAEARGDGRPRQGGRQVALSGVFRGAGAVEGGRRQGQHGRGNAHDRADGQPPADTDRRAEALPVRREGDPCARAPRQADPLPEDGLQPHRRGRHGREPRGRRRTIRAGSDARRGTRTPRRSCRTGAASRNARRRRTTRRNSGTRSSTPSSRARAAGADSSWTSTSAPSRSPSSRSAPSAGGRCRSRSSG